ELQLPGAFREPVVPVLRKLRAAACARPLLDRDVVHDPVCEPVLRLHPDPFQGKARDEGAKGEAMARGRPRDGEPFRRLPDDGGSSRADRHVAMRIVHPQLLDGLGVAGRDDGRLDRGVPGGGQPALRPSRARSDVKVSVMNLWNFLASDPYILMCPALRVTTPPARSTTSWPVATAGRTSSPDRPAGKRS